MARKSLTDSEMLEIVYKSDKSFSVSSSDNDSDDITLADVIINDDRGDEEHILHRDFRWETTDNYRGQREVFSCDFGCRNGAENVSGIVGCFELFSDKEIQLKKGEITARHSGPVTVLKWDKRNVTKVSTYHSADNKGFLRKARRQRSLWND
jgi:hypothetical protein